MHRIDYTPEQARKVLECVPAGTFYHREALRVLGQGPDLANRVTPVPGIDVPGLPYAVTNDDDGDGV